MARGDRALRIKFYGVRGSTPCSCEANQGIGGNTACVVVDAPDSEPIVFDLGTGLRFWGLAHPHPPTAPFRATALVSHLHWDHVQGLPFFTPLHDASASLHVIGPPQQGVSLEEAFNSFLCPPYFPVTLADLAGSITFEEATGTPITVGHAKVTTCEVPHVGPTLGFRVECDGRSVAYVSDHQQPGPGSSDVDDRVLELCDGVDLLIHDAQYTQQEFVDRLSWGHCTTEYALEVAVQAGARRLALFHHDPSHDDAMVARLTADVDALSRARGGPEVFAAAEGCVVDL